MLRDYTAPVWSLQEDKPFFIEMDFEGEPHLYFDFEEPEYKAHWGRERDDLIATLSRVEGAAEIGRMERFIPLKLVARHLERIISELEDLGSDHVKDAISVIEPIAEAFLVRQRERLLQSLEHGIEFEDLGLLFDEGDLILANISGEPVAGIFQSAQIERDFSGVRYEFQFEIIHNLGGGVQINNCTVAIRKYKGFKKVATLAVQRLTEEKKAELAERGAVYRKYVTEPSYLNYDGLLTRSNWRGDTAFNAKGRVMIDARAFSRADPDQWSMEDSASPADVSSGRHASLAAMEITDEDLWRTYPFLFGFSFVAKQWGRIAVSGLSDIVFRSDAWEKLVLDQRYKEIVKALVENSGKVEFADLIDDKGGGVIFMLDGPPGEGKTLTAETVAEMLQRPLYPVSIGELGTNADTLERRLRSILDIATAWNAVLLLDEADIFLEARDEHNIERNAMVGICLRLLEYYKGILFLTTNRVKNIDEAFYSRIAVFIHFQVSDHAKRVQVWRNLLIAAKLFSRVKSDPITEDEVQELATIPMNGRQIKNVIRQTQVLAKARGWTVTMMLFREVIAICQPAQARHLGRGLQRSVVSRVKDAWGALFG